MAFNQKRWGQVICLISFFIFTFSILTIFTFDRVYQAGQKPLWGDETFALHNTIRSHSYADLFINGANGQSSPAPLDYLLCKIWDQIGQANNYFQLSPEIYFRLFSIFIYVLVMVTTLVIFAKEIYLSSNIGPVAITQWILLGFVSVAFLYAQMIHFYALEMRPYASWTAIWFLSLVLFFSEKKNFGIREIALILLALSATTSFFQLGALAVAFFVINFIIYKDVKVFIEALKFFGLPILISLYYCLKVTQWVTGSEEALWENFWDFYSGRATTIPLMLLCMGLCFGKKECRIYAVAPLAVLFIFLLGPLLFFLIKLKGYFFNDRQFIYYAVVNAVFLLTIIKCLPYYISKLKGWMVYFIVIAVICAGVGLTFRKKIQQKIYVAAENTLLIIQSKAPR